MNCKMLFLKLAKLSELLILLSRFFDSIAVDGKNEFLKKVCVTLNRGMLSILFLVLCAVLVVGILSKQIFRGLIFSSLKEIAKFFKPRPL